MASKQVKDLAERLRKEFDIPADPERFYRTYAGHWQRSAGAYSWIMYFGKHGGMVGGFEPIGKHIVKRNKLEISERGFMEFAVYAYAPGEPGYDRSQESNIKEEGDCVVIEI